MSLINFISDYPFNFTMRPGKKDEFSPFERMFVYELKLAGKWEQISKHAEKVPEEVWEVVPMFNVSFRI